MTNDIEKFGGIETVSIRFVEDEGPLRPEELSSFLYDSKVVYTYLYKQMIENDITIVGHSGLNQEAFEYIQRNREQIISELRNEIPNQGWGKYNLGQRDLGEGDIYIQQIEKKSPFSVAFVGVLFILLVVVAICGGDAKLNTIPPGFEISLNKTLGEGLQDLQEVFDNDSGTEDAEETDD